MNHYEDFLQTLPLDAVNIDVFIAHESYMTKDETNNVIYYRINDTDACAVVTGINKDCPWRISIEREVAHSRLFDFDDSDSISKIPVRMVYFHKSNKCSYFDIPDTVCSILGSENVDNYRYQPFSFENNQYFEIIDGWVYSADGEDLIYGRWQGSFNDKLHGVKTIHNIAPGYEHDSFLSLNVPSSVEKIIKITDGYFSSVIFEGKLPEFAEGALKDVSIEDIAVYTRYRENNPNAVKALMMVPKDNDTHRYGKNYWRRTEESTLFAPAEPVIKTPVAKGYIALTNARFDCDGDPVLINTQFIATICPKTVRRCDYKAEGSTILIGLEKDGQETRGIWYDVYEDPDMIDSLIAGAQN